MMYTFKHKFFMSEQKENFGSFKIIDHLAGITSEGVEVLLNKSFS